MNVPERLRQLMDERGLTTYALAKASGLHWQTIQNLFTRTSNPSVYTMSCICKGLGITMAQFFSDDSGEAVVLTEEQRHWLMKMESLSDDEKQVIRNMIDIIEKKKR